jgi:hypothetical protein
MHRRGAESVRRTLLLAGLLSALSGRPAWTQANGSEEDAGLNYAFASQLGSGIYDLSGRTVQIYRIPFFFPVRNAEDRSPGIRVTLPVCLGFFNRDPEDVDQTDVQEDVATLSFVPGVALEIPVLRNWSLEPFAEVGVARDFRSSGGAYVYSLGLKSLVTLRARELELLVGNRLLYVGEHTPGVEVDEDFAMLETGFEVRQPLRYAVKGHGIDWGPYVMNYLYLEPTEVFLKEEPLEIGAQYELGITIGTQEPVPLWRFKVPRLGLGYRFGDGVSAVRLVLGAAF